MNNKQYNLTAAQAIIIGNLIKRCNEVREQCRTVKRNQKAAEILKDAEDILKKLEPVYSLIEWINDNTDLIKLAMKAHALAEELRELAIEQMKNPCEEALNKEGCEFTTEAIGDLCAQQKFNEGK